MGAPARDQLHGCEAGLGLFLSKLHYVEKYLKLAKVAKGLLKGKIIFPYVKQNFQPGYPENK